MNRGLKIEECIPRMLSFQGKACNAPLGHSEPSGAVPIENEVIVCPEMRGPQSKPLSGTPTTVRLTKDSFVISQPGSSWEWPLIF
jgi:uncharacterized protein YbaR (Trm112 family)